MKKPPLVSVIMPAYNSEKHIDKSIESVIRQTFSDWELIVVDDCSSDSTAIVVSRYVALDKRIKLISCATNQGAAASRNLAIENSLGRFVAFLDSDDLWCPKKLEVQVSFMLNSKIYFSYGPYEIIDESGNFIDFIAPPDSVKYHDLLKTNYIGCLTAMYDTSALGKLYMPLIRKRQDLGLWLKILKIAEEAYSVPACLGSYRVRNDSISSNKIIAAKYTWRLYREYEGLGFLKAFFYFSNYAVRGFYRAKVRRFLLSLREFL